jgi:peptidoglycan/LPS O-acetylase OafA/YrhL
MAVTPTARIGAPGRVHIGALDGIRGVAVLAVLFHHLTYGHFPGGFLGVELFFVLSGYLITYLLLAEKQRTGAISLRWFYARRALRLLPALLLTLILVSVFQAVRPLHDVFSFPWTVVAVLAYVANWVSFPGGASLGYLGHVWSLSIEEQFYALWPLALVFLPLDRNRARWLAIVCGAGVVLAAAATALVYLWLRPPGEAMSYATFTHVPAILFGCLLALPTRRGIIAARLSSQWLAIAAGLALLLMMFLVRKDAAYMYLGGYCLAGLLAALLIANVASNPSSLPGKLFSNASLQAVGKVSYGLYLYHLPIVLFTEGLRTHGWANFLWVSALRVVLTLGLAFASYHFIERRFLSLKKNFTRLQTG